jgi:alpha-glucosidase
MPYVYTLAEEASRTGAPLMRPVWLEHPDLEMRGADENRMFFFGPDLLVEPKLDEMLDPLDVVVPPGPWYDYWTGERRLGPAHKNVRIDLGDLVVLVRGGAIVPHQPLVQSTGEIPRGPLELRVYPGPDCRGSLYMDDGVTFDYRKGEFLRLTVSCEEKADSVRVTTGAAEGSYRPWFGSIAFVIHGLRSAPKQVSVDGTPVHDFRYDGTKKAVTVVAPYAKTGQIVTVIY